MRARSGRLLAASNPHFGAQPPKQLSRRQHHYIFDRDDGNDTIIIENNLRTMKRDRKPALSSSQLARIPLADTRAIR